MGGLSEHLALADEAEQRAPERRGAAQGLGRAGEHRRRRGQAAQLVDGGAGPVQAVEASLEARPQPVAGNLVLAHPAPGVASAQRAQAARELVDQLAQALGLAGADRGAAVTTLTEQRPRPVARVAAAGR